MNLRICLLGTVSSLGLLGTAMAADLPVKAAPAMIPVSNWTGPYIGGHVGAGSLTGNMINNGTEGVCELGNACMGQVSGVIAGVQAGYNWQTRYWVWGVEADWTWTDLNRTWTSSNASDSFRHRVDWLASFRGRMGIALEDTMVYATGGLALGHIKNGWNDGYVSAACCDVAFNDTRVGWVAGFGVEHMLNRNWSIKGEALYYDLGRATRSDHFNSGTYRTEVTNTIVVGRLGINYRW